MKPLFPKLVIKNGKVLVIQELDIDGFKHFDLTKLSFDFMSTEEIKKALEESNKQN